MQRTTLSCVVVVLLVALSGCNAFGTGNTPTEMSGVSPAPVPTDSPTPTPGPADIPGLTAQGIDNASALVSAHNATVRNTSFTAHRNTTVRYTNGTVAFRQSQIARVNETRERFFMETHRDWGRTLLVVASSEAQSPSLSDYPTPSTVTLWSNSDRMSMKIERDNTTEHSTWNLDDSSTTDSSRESYRYARRFSSRAGAEYFPRALDGLETRITGKTTRNGTTLYRIESSSPSIRTAPVSVFVQIAPIPIVEASGNVTVRALVDARGTIHESTLSYETRVGPDRIPVNTTYTTRFTDLGSTRVERPAWVENATNRSNSTGT